MLPGGTASVGLGFKIEGTYRGRGGSVAVRDPVSCARSEVFWRVPFGRLQVLESKITFAGLLVPALVLAGVVK